MMRRRFLAGATALFCLAPGYSIAQPTNESSAMQQSLPKFATSLDGTRIAYWTQGQGPLITIVAGAFNDHNTGAEFAAQLAEIYTVVTYDRRGRGSSGDAAGYAPDKEIDDLAAVITANGDSAMVIGFSSGASLIMMAAAVGAPITKLVAIDAPWMLSDAGPRPSLDVGDRLRNLVEDGKPGEAVELFQRDYVGMPEDLIVQMRSAPFRPYLEGMALTTSYDAEIMGDLSLPSDLVTKIAQPVLLLAGEESPPWMSETATAIAGNLRDGKYGVVIGIGHDLAAEIVPYLRDFLTSE